jgi:hypothetical protein
MLEGCTRFGVTLILIGNIMKMSYPSSKLHIPNSIMEYFRFAKILTPSQRNMQAVKKTWLKSESNIAKHGMMPITKNRSPRAQNSKIQN